MASAQRSLTWSRIVLEGTRAWRANVPKPWRKHGHGATLVHAEQLVPPHVMAELRNTVLGTSGKPRLRFDQDSDSVDGSPTHEIRWVRAGQYTHAAFRDLFAETIEMRLLPLLRSSAVAPGPPAELVLCEALVRMYDDGARRVHPAHYDADALVTAVLEVDLSDGDGARTFDGPGFYVQPGAHVNTRVAVPLAPGDVVAHSFDLQHGVAITSGRRCSVVFWFADSAASCASKERPWHTAPAKAGDADALYNVGAAIDRARSDPRRARQLLTSAASQGHFMAQNDLGLMLMEGRGCAGAEPRLIESEAWLRAAAEQGFHRAMVSLSALCERSGRGVEALEWLMRAAEQRADPSTLFELGRVHVAGVGPAPRCEATARRWLGEAAAMGHPEAQLAMGRLETDARDEGAAERWLHAAAEQGSIDAALALARHYVRRAEPAKLCGLAWRCCERASRVSSKWSRGVW